MTVKRVATGGLMLALALILSFIDSLIPMPIPIPGVKLGLANLAVLFALYRLGEADAILISIARVILSGMLFSGMSGIIYSLAGAFLSLTVMILLHRLTDFHIVTISVFGSVAHITGQLVVAGLWTDMSIVSYYAPILLITAFGTGIVIGILTSVLHRNIREIV